MILIRSFPYPKKTVISGIVLHEWVTYYTIEGREGIIEIFDAEGKSTPELKVWQWADELKRKEMKVKR